MICAFDESTGTQGLFRWCVTKRSSDCTNSDKRPVFRVTEKWLPTDARHRIALNPHFWGASDGLCGFAVPCSAMQPSLIRTFCFPVPKSGYARTIARESGLSGTQTEIRWRKRPPSHPKQGKSPGDWFRWTTPTATKSLILKNYSSPPQSPR